MTGIRQAFETLARDRSAVALEERLGGIPGLIGFDSFLGIEAARENARSYGLLDVEVTR